MNAAQRRKLIRQRQKEWPIGSRVRIGDNRAARGMLGTIISIGACNYYPVKVKLDSHIAVRQGLYDTFSFDFNELEKV